MVALVAQLCPTLCDSMDCKPARLLCPWDSPGKNTGVGCHSPEDLSDPGVKPRSPTLQADSLPSELQGSPDKNNGVGSHSLLQGIFRTQGSNVGLMQVDSLPSEPPGKHFGSFFFCSMSFSDNVEYVFSWIAAFILLACGYGD